MHPKVHFLCKIFGHIKKSSTFAADFGINYPEINPRWSQDHKNKSNFVSSI